MPAKRKQNHKAVKSASLNKWLIPGTEDLCVREFRLFRSGGEPALAVLERVWQNILKEHDVPLHRGYAICLRAGLRMKDNGRIRTVGE
jgi:hypothetical protein